MEVLPKHMICIYLSWEFPKHIAIFAVKYLIFSKRLVNSGFHMKQSEHTETTGNVAVGQGNT